MCPVHTADADATQLSSWAMSRRCALGFSLSACFSVAGCSSCLFTCSATLSIVRLSATWNHHHLRSHGAGQVGAASFSRPRTPSWASCIVPAPESWRPPGALGGGLTEAPHRGLSCIWIRDVHGLDSSMDWIGLDWVRWLKCTELWRPMFSAKQTETILCNNQWLLTYLILIIFTAVASLAINIQLPLTAQMKSNSETYLMMFSPIKWTMDWIGLGQ